MLLSQVRIMPVAGVSISKWQCEPVATPGSIPMEQVLLAFVQLQLSAGKIGECCLLKEVQAPRLVLFASIHYKYRYFCLTFSYLFTSFAIKREYISQLRSQNPVTYLQSVTFTYCSVKFTPLNSPSRLPRQ